MKRKCKVCRQPATMTVGLYAVCSIEHGAELGMRLRAKERAMAARKAKAEHRAQKRKVERLRDLLDRVERACNAYVRERDYGRPCISCGKHSVRMEAGHWKAVGRGGASPARFHPDNIHLQCHSCNVHGGGGNHPGYLPALLEKIGPDRMAAVARLHAGTVKWDRAALEQLAAWFRREMRAMKKIRERA